MRFFHQIVLGLLLAVTVGFTHAAVRGETKYRAAAADSPAAFVESLGDDAIEILFRSKASDRLKDRRLDDLLRDRMGIRIMCRFIVGDEWEAADLAQRQAFRETFRRYLFIYLIGMLDDAEIEDFEVVATEPIDEISSRVTTEVNRFGIELAEVDWIVRDTGRDYEVVDILMDGISLLQTFYADLGGYARREGLSALTIAMERKMARR